MFMVVIILGVLYLCGINVGKALAICAIVYGALDLFLAVLKKLGEKK